MKNKAYKSVSVIVPVYNEEGTIPEMAKRLCDVLDEIEEPSEIIFINDGSRDASMELVKGLCQKNSRIKAVAFSRNFGHQIAVTAGLDHCNGDCAIIIDADLQDPPELIPEMIGKWNQGYEVVYAKRIRRQGESFLKRATASAFYRIVKKMTNIDIPVDTGDFRLIDRRVVDALKAMPERNRFVRGMVSWLGFRQTGIEYTRHERFSGSSHYPMARMLKFAITGITSLSYIPLQLATWFGFIVSGASFLYGLYALYLKYFTDKTIQGWTSLMMVIVFLGGIQLITLGIIGEYIGRMYEEIKQRPVYVVNEKINL